MTSRPLHAVLLPPEAAGGRLLDALSAALDGSGPAILPLDPALPRARLGALLDVFAPSAIETAQGTKRLHHRTRPGSAGPASAGPASAGPAAAGPASASPGAASPGAASSASASSASASRASASPGVRPEVAVVIATSGSTGHPKGAELTAAALLAAARASLDRIGAEAGQRWLCCLPAFHVAGVQVLVRSLLAGAAPVVSGRLDADVLARADCPYVSLVPTQLRRLLDDGAPLAAFRAILLGGAAPPAGLLAQARAAGARVITTYGMSETCGGCVYDGMPLDGVSAAVGGDGRIRIAGPVLFSGYRLRPDLTAAALDGDWFVTSDLGSIDEAGRLVILGRADDLINSGGEKVVAAEVEAVLGSCRGVRDVVVVAVPDPEWGERVTALVVPADPASPPGLDLLRDHARGRLPAYAAPRGLVLLAEIPLLPSGKPDREAMRKLGSEVLQEGVRHSAGNNRPR